MSTDENLLKTPLYDLHVERGGKMVPFAGYLMPVQYPLGIMKEHEHTRSAAGLFDVSHMGQCYIRATDGGDPAAALEKLMPGALQVLKPGKMRYTLLLNDEGGIEDDLMVTRTHEPDGMLYVVVNAACKDKDYAILEEKLAGQITLEPLDDRALIALQGPKAEAVLAALAPEVADLGFMEATAVTLEGVVCWVSRSGYTGEDGYEISIPQEEVDAFTRRLLQNDDVELIGLGARDSLRLEAGLCLSGHDFDASVSPVEAAVTFALGKKRREDGDFIGAERILKELADGPKKVRVGIQPEGRAPAREGTPVADMDGNEIGVITSGGFGPTAGGPVAMGFVPAAFATVGTEIQLIIRGKAHPAKVAALPFVEQRYKRKTS
ncbi:glycine cleavage system aminomethyltransferase GcvT [Kordiimonas marina]|uniref:glycine cleavage system aminomethyltransferase GcvT n=1 Tax=Kordiimonas marina TaxID=2872312 RepID=UPI001FF36F8E|nr:glycine cleavage system aminomethyltransferase GcvT [Kordiimonas marina]MCJ9429431.1 glycine cleavage system aminomethyltransferase GcvT [Kordiimonas marina]